MKVDECIHAVLNHGQLEYFCEKFNLEASDIKSNFDGWRKLVLYTNDRVFIFPRDPSVVEWLEREILAYEIMDGFDHLPVPKLLERVNNSKISYYEFAVITRLNGIAYSKLEDEISLDDLTKMLLNLAKVIASWHEIPTKDLPAKIRQKNYLDETLYSWEIKALNPSTMMEAFAFVHKTILEYAEKYHKNLFEILRSDKTRSLWIACLKEIVSLPHVLLHADIHEDQILVESKET
ncbi:MAG: aminoglycoside phosphotransferase family protein, partial [Candidatus Hodarchaeales archaeon]